MSLGNLSSKFQHELYSCIGIENGPIFVGGVFLIFGLGWILAEPAVYSKGPSTYDVTILEGGRVPQNGDA